MDPISEPDARIILAYADAMHREALGLYRLTRALAAVTLIGLVAALVVL